MKDVTAALANALLNQFVAARTAVAAQEKLLADIVADRRAKAAVLRKRIRDTIAELKMRLSPLDTRWLAFKLNRPGAMEVAEVQIAVSTVNDGGESARSEIVTITSPASGRK